MEHLTHDQRAALVASIRMAYEYLLEFASDAEMFAMMAGLAQTASQVAYRVAQTGDEMLEPQIGATMENLTALAAQQALAAQRG